MRTVTQETTFRCKPPADSPAKQALAFVLLGGILGAVGWFGMGHGRDYGSAGAHGFSLHRMSLIGPHWDFRIGTRRRPSVVNPGAGAINT